MDPITELSTELLRLQILAFSRPQPARVEPNGLVELSEWTRLSPRQCSFLADALAEEGFLEPLPDGPARFHLPLRLTPVGSGFLQWYQQQVEAHGSRRIH